MYFSFFLYLCAAVYGVIKNNNNNIFRMAKARRCQHERQILTRNINLQRQIISQVGVDTVT